MSFLQSPLAISLVLVAMVFIAPAAALTPNEDNNARAKRFVEQYEATLRPLEIEAARLFWTANITGKEADYQKNRRPKRRSTSASPIPSGLPS
jgi:hypothetical protein